MTCKYNRTPLLCYFKLCASFHSHWWIQTGVTVRKRPMWIKFRRFFEPCDFESWRMTFKNNRAPLLSNIKLCALFHCHMCGGSEPSTPAVQPLHPRPFFSSLPPPPFFSFFFRVPPPKNQIFLHPPPPPPPPYLTPAQSPFFVYIWCCDVANIWWKPLQWKMCQWIMMRF